MSDDDRPKVIALHTREAYEGEIPEYDTPPEKEPEHGDVMLLDHVMRKAMAGETSGVLMIVGTMIDGKLQMESYTSPAVDDDVAHFIGGMELQKALLVQVEMRRGSEVMEFEE